MKRHISPTLITTIRYRLWQVREHLGFTPPLSSAQDAEVAALLPPAAFSLFKTMSPADQQHSLRVCRGLQARGCTEPDMLAAALLHDVGKAQGRAPFWTRPAIVLGKRCAPALLKRLTLSPSLLKQGCLTEHLSGASHESGVGARNKSIPRWRRSLSYAWWHAEIGAELAAPTGLSERALLYIRTHHQPDGPARELHIVDEVS